MIGRTPAIRRRNAPFDAEALRRLLAPHFGSLAFAQVSLMDEGGDFANYDIDDTLVVRIPRNAESARGLAVERKLLPRLRPVLPVALPAFEHVQEPDRQFPYGLGVYRKIHGLSGEAHRPPPAQRGQCAKRLGRILSALHAFPVDEARACGVRAARSLSPGILLGRVARYAPLIRSETPQIVVDEVEHYLRGRVATPRAGGMRGVLSHHDLKGEHYILSEQGDDIAGIIDWADARIGDRATDFVGVALWLGMPFVDQVLSHYELPIDDGLVDRVRFYNQCMRLIQLGQRLAGEWDAPRELLLTQTRWAFAALSS